MRLSARSRVNRAVKTAISYIFLCILTALCLFVFYVLFINATRFNAEIRREFAILPGRALGFNFRKLNSLDSIPIFRGLLNSMIIAGSVAALSSYFSALTAYGIHMYNFKFRKAAYIFILLLMMVPTQVAATGFIKMVYDWKLTNSFLPLIIPSISSPIIFFFMKKYLEANLQYEIVESARVDGANEFLTFHKIILPIMRPALAVQAIFAFVSSWNNYFIPALLLTSREKKTVPILIGLLRSMDDKTDLGMIYLMVLIGVAPLIIMYLLLSRFIIKGVTIGSVKG
ncbi:MAG TPA: carbohydrate ABC transporter permease [Acholeplasmataceae bacterium]|nr:carbohydrate ABC transporter permease [Acholeplasmataceae bacterium]